MRKFIFLLSFLLHISFVLFSCKKDDPTNGVVIGNNLEVMTTDLGKFNYNDAIIEVNKLGNGWRLPTTREWELICNNRDKVPNLVYQVSYWSSEVNPLAANSIFGYISLTPNFTNCPTDGYLYRDELHFTRAVRSK